MIVILILIRIIAVPILVVLYLLPIPFLLLRNLFQYICVGLDWLFDRVGGLAGWNTQGWPIPRAQDEPVPFVKSYWAGWEDAESRRLDRVR